MRNKLTAILIVVLLLPMTIFAQNKIIKSSNLALYENENIEIVNFDQNYAEQLGLKTKTIDSLNLVNTAISDKDYLVTVSDVYSLTYYEGYDLVTLPIQVMLGDIVIPTVGTFSVENKTFVELKDEIESALLNQNLYSYPNLTIVSVGKFDVEVRGEVYSNSKVPVNSLTYLSDLAVYATANASTREVEILDVNNNSTTYDLYAALQGNGVNPRIKYGDVIIFKEAKNEVVLSGAINKAGKYQLVELSLDSLIDDLAKGLTTYADSSVIEVNRYIDSVNTKILVSYGDDFTLQDGDVIYVPAYDGVKGTVIIEGALVGATEFGDQKYFYQFKNGDTLYDLVQDIAPYYSSSSDLVNTYLTRDSKSTLVSFADVLSGSIDLDLQDGDVYTLPYSQAVVNVLGAVNKGGLFSIMPGKTAEYYINLAQGYSTAAKGVGNYIVKDKNGNVVDKDAVITAESTIEVEKDKVGPSLERTTVVLGITTASLAIITSVLSILNTTNVI